MLKVKHCEFCGGSGVSYQRKTVDLGVTTCSDKVFTTCKTCSGTGHIIIEEAVSDIINQKFGKAISKLN